VHRDIKPDNVMVDEAGRVKVLDFGLAKLYEGAPDAGEASHLPTASVTAEGRIIGTVAYMSPEQAEGKPVDPRSDVFSLGILLHEAATGERPFQGDTSLSIITSILRDTPQSVPQLNRKMPRQLGRIVKRCLAKEPSRRYQSAIGLRNELEELRDEMASGELEPAAGAAMTPARTNRPRLIATGLVGAAALVALGYGLSRWIAPGARSTLPTEPTFTKLTDLPGSERGAELSPDGKSLARRGAQSYQPDRRRRSG
jgi:serine/threonine protein kinase